MSGNARVKWTACTCFTTCENAAPQRVQLLPLDVVWLKELAKRPWRSRTLPAFTMEPEELLSALIRQHLFVTLYRGMAGSLASEHATRLLAMQTAERNIEEHLTEMMTAYHHKRQEAITEELLDITSGFEVSGSQQ